MCKALTFLGTSQSFNQLASFVANSEKYYAISAQGIKRGILYILRKLKLYKEYRRIIQICFEWMIWEPRFNI